MLGPLVAIVAFVCSIGNVLLAAVPWAGGASFGVLLAFFCADLIVLPLLNVHRRYFGWRMAAYMNVVFLLLGIVPTSKPDVRGQRPISASTTMSG